MNYSEAAKAQLSGHTVRMDVLVEFHFVSGIVRLWNGFGELKTNDGKTWLGTGNMGDISGLAQSLNGTAPPVTLSLSGVDSTFALKAKAEAEEYYNQPLVVYLQFFDEDWQCLDDPYGLTMARMANITSRMDDDGQDRTYTISITAETPFATRRRPPFGYLTDRDQQLRFPGDRGLERVAGIDNKNITFPAY
jgi:hypothetical protein